MKHKRLAKIKVLDCGTIKELETEINKAIKDGWKIEEYWCEKNDFFQSWFAIGHKYKKE